MQRIEKFWSYDLETVLNSMFCYKLPKRTPDSEPSPVSWPIVGCRGTHLFPISKIFSWRNVICIELKFEIWLRFFLFIQFVSAISISTT